MKREQKSRERNGKIHIEKIADPKEPPTPNISTHNHDRFEIE